MTRRVFKNNVRIEKVALAENHFVNGYLKRKSKFEEFPIRQD